MALNQTTQFASAVSFFGILSFVLGIVAELKKVTPAAGTPIPGKDGVICIFPKDPSVALGALSAISVLISSAVGLYAIHFPYKGQSVPRKALLASITMKIFYYGAIVLTITGVGATLFNTINEGLIHARNVHEDLEYRCPTAKTGLFGGASFLNLDASLFWLVCQMLVRNAREDYFDYEEEGEVKDDYIHISNN
ncbi:hypothetical protein KFK09_016905 [Dendrobium nobile]|uniref:Uncharacterized protein n=1 Tax=Dendrobium nobile TaxID=94219 RepID=A0A8T3B0T0_DENNO|nr:hypothetical protein KFK09_016905 [Dendrobium nobile]